MSIRNNATQKTRIKMRMLSELQIPNNNNNNMTLDLNDDMTVKCHRKCFYLHNIVPKDDSNSDTIRYKKFLRLTSIAPDTVCWTFRGALRDLHCAHSN